VCTSWCRPPELWALTIDDHHLDGYGNATEVEMCAGTHYGTSLDVWSFGAVVYEVLSGSTLVGRARTGAAMAKTVADVIGACPTEPCALEYTQCRQWATWGAASDFIDEAPDASRRLPESGAQWDVVRRCLRWDPEARESMSSLQRCTWLATRPSLSVTSGASPLAASSSPPPGQPEPRPGTSTHSDGAATPIAVPRRNLVFPPGAPSRLQVEERVQEYIKLEPPPTTTATSQTRCACSGHCRLYKHRRDSSCPCTQLVVGTS
jgi:serine/threonine protein kinase